VAASKQADYLVFSSKYTIQTPGGEPMTDENNQNRPEDDSADSGHASEENPEDLRNEIADRDKKIEQMKQDKSEIEASNTKLQKKVEELEQVLASREKEKATSVPMEKVNELIETKANEIAAARIKEYRDELQRTAALEKLTAARSELGLETKGEEYKHLSAADLEKLADEFGGIKVTAGTMFQYPAGESGKSRTGVYNPVSGVFE
jgi:predicted RNase H-like nuclease (RuvC/YqgF family)